MADHFYVLRKFIEEEGQEKGSVSGQMALDSLGMLRDRILEWSGNIPNSPGLYLYRSERDRWGYEIIPLENGDWRLAQNPAWLYNAKGKLVNDMNPGQWFGPIPPLPDVDTPCADSPTKVG